MSCLFLFLACSNEQLRMTREEEKNETQVAVNKVSKPDAAILSAEKTSTNNADMAVTKQLTLVEDKKNKLAKFLKDRGDISTITLNGGKFTLHSARFGKGSKVYNMQMGGYGLIKGDIVVVSIEKIKAKDIQYSATQVRQIAKNTFRLSPDKTVELMPFYKTIIKSKRFSVVEMEIDYSPIKELVEY